MMQFDARIRALFIAIVILTLWGCSQQPTTRISAAAAPVSAAHPDGKTRIYLAGDSTVTNQMLNEDYWEKRHPVTGWGQKFAEQFTGDNLSRAAHWVSSQGVVIENKAKGGRSTRTFFEEGRWREIVEALKPGDIVIIQFGHNDQAVEKTERYVTLAGYQEYLRLFIRQTREKGGLPILLTPVNRNYPWQPDGSLGNSHGEYPDAARAIAREMNVALIDLGHLSREFFARAGQQKVSTEYFMNLPAGKFPAYPEGVTDNTHFQPEGARVVAQWVFEALVALPRQP